MKGSPFAKGTISGTQGHRIALKKLSLNRSMDNSSMPDGRAKSSAFQLTEDERKLISQSSTTFEPTKKTTVEPNKKGGHTTTVETTTSGEDTKTFEKPAVDAFKKACYSNGDGTGTFYKGQVINGIKCELAGDDWKKEDEQDIEVIPTSTRDLVVSDTEGEIEEKPRGVPNVCHCKGQAQYSADHSQGSGGSTSHRSWESYFCGYKGDGTNKEDYQKHPNCMASTQATKDSRASSDRTNLDGVVSAGLQKSREKGGGNATDNRSDSYEMPRQDWGQSNYEANTDIESNYLGEGGGAEGNKNYSRNSGQQSARGQVIKELKLAHGHDGSKKGGGKEWRQFIKANPTAVKDAVEGMHKFE